MSLQKKITLVVSLVLITTLLTMLFFSVSGVINIYSVEQLTNLIPEGTTAPAASISVTEENILVRNLNIARNAFSSRLVFVLLIVIIVGIFVTYQLVGKSLKSLVNLKTSMSNLDTKNLEEKISINKKQPAEIQTLATSYNGMIQRLNESFSKQKHFVNNAAHELKTPLSVVTTYAQIIQMNHPDTELVKMTDAILVSCEKLALTLEQLLILANDNLLELTDDVATNDLILQSFDNVKGLADARGIRLENSNTHHFQFKGNQVMLEVALNNLIENAVKYSTENAFVSVETRLKNNCIQIDITNQSQLLQLEELELIFEPFYRGQENDSQIVGNGLGLALVKKIAESHHGSVTCTIHNKEITFCLELPY